MTSLRCRSYSRISSAVSESLPKCCDLSIAISISNRLISSFLTALGLLVTTSGVFISGAAVVFLLILRKVFHLSCAISFVFIFRFSSFSRILTNGARSYAFFHFLPSSFCPWTPIYHFLESSDTMLVAVDLLIGICFTITLREIDEIPVSSM